ncbi:HupE/UreJ family protein [Microbulbifer sp. ANSA002]|uniref:HupE/UreJ family protein n=1 Tax=unclassified Microbulbifer TaxID=2619833 RepID=UPI004041B42E
MLNRSLYKTITTIIISLLGTIFNNLSFAHDGRPLYIELKEISESRYILRWKTPPVMQPGTEPEVSLTGNFCQRHSTTLDFSGRHVKSYLCQASHLHDFKGAENTLKLKISYPIANPALSSLIQYKKLKGDTINIFSGPKILVIDLPYKLTIWECIKQYIEAGFLHILEGYDHLLFVLCLVFIAQGLKSILVAISGFTLGHSLTLGLASLNLFSIRIDVVEVLIPLSIMFLSAEIVYAIERGNKNTLTWRYPAIVAGGFGLLHGFGFASALTELGLPQSQKIIALFSFNIGVELGQILFVLVTIASIFLTKWTFSRWSVSFFYKHILAQSGYIIYPVGVVSAYWSIDRALGLIY